MKTLLFFITLVAVVGKTRGVHRGSSVSIEDSASTETRLHKRPFSPEIRVESGLKVRRDKKKRSIHSNTVTSHQPLDSIRSSSAEEFKHNLEKLFKYGPSYLESGACELMSAFGIAEEATIILALEQLRDIDIDLRCDLKFPFYLAQTTPLHLAARLGKSSLIRYLCGRGANTEAMDLHGRTALHLAIQFGHASAVSTLLELGASLETSDKFGFSAREHLLQSSLAEVWTVFCEHQREYLRRLLSGLISAGHRTSIKTLLRYCPLGEELDDRGMAPIHEAVQRWTHAETVEELLNLNLSPNQQSRDGNTALHYALLGSLAVTWSSTNLEVLLRHGADVNLVNKDGESPLALALRLMVEEESPGVFLVSAPEKWLDVVQLLRHGADARECLATPTEIARELLYSALESLDLGPELTHVALLLLERGIRIDDTCYQEASAVHVAAMAQNASVLQFLLQHAGADANILTTSGKATPLFFAAYAGSAAAIEMLVRHGADPDARNEHGDTTLLMLFRPREAQDVWFEGLLAQVGLEEFAPPDRTRAVAALLKAGASVNAQDREGRSALALALREEEVQEEEVFLMLKFGAEIHLADNMGLEPMAINRPLLETTIARLSTKSAMK